MRRGPEIRFLLRHGARKRCGPLEAYRAAARGDASRVGIVVPRYGHSVARRNQLQRRLRELARTLWLPAARDRTAEANGAADLLVRARPGAYEADFQALREAFLGCAEVSR